MLHSSLTSPGIARTLFMEQRSKYVASINLDSAAPPSPATLTAVLRSRKEYGVSVCNNRVYSLLLAPGSAACPRPLDSRPGGIIQSALVTGGSRVSQKSGDRILAVFASSGVCGPAACAELQIRHTSLLVLPHRGWAWSTAVNSSGEGAALFWWHHDRAASLWRQ